MISAGYKSAYQQGYSDAMSDFRKKSKTDVLDKIRTEISALESHHINDCYDDGFQGCRANVLQIINKYKSESEE